MMLVPAWAGRVSVPRALAIAQRGLPAFLVVLARQRPPTLRPVLGWLNARVRRAASESERRIDVPTGGRFSCYGPATAGCWTPAACTVVIAGGDSTALQNAVNAAMQVESLCCLVDKHLVSMTVEDPATAAAQWTPTKLQRDDWRRVYSGLSLYIANSIIGAIGPELERLEGN